MLRTVVLGTGQYVPERVVTNEDLANRFDTSDEWIQKRTGIQERRHVDFDNDPMGPSEMGARAAREALANAGVTVDEVDLIIHATLSAEKVFPGDGVLVQAKLGVPAGVPAMDIRNQCSGFLYGLSVANAFIKTGVYRRILLIGAELHSTGLDFSDAGRDVAVIFGDGAAAVLLGPDEGDDGSRGVLSVHLHADGRFANELQVAYPTSCELPRIRADRLGNRDEWPYMNGKLVFRNAVVRMPEAVDEVLAANGLAIGDVDLLIPHQANLRISEFLQRRLELPDEKVFNNIQKYGNTTACSIPLALHEAVTEGRVKSGDLVCLVAFGSGFTWASALIRW